MNEIDKKIVEHYKNSKNLKEIYLGNKNISYEKSVELSKKQDEEYNKMIFLKGLRKEMAKNECKR